MKHVVKGACHCRLALQAPKRNPLTSSHNLSSLSYRRSWSHLSAVRNLSATPIYTGDDLRHYSQNAPFLRHSQNAPFFTRTLVLSAATPVRAFHLSSRSFATAEDEPLKPSSKVEETVKALKEKAKEEAKEKKEGEGLVKKEVAVKKKSIAVRVKEELLHYWHGFRLLGIDINVCRKLIWRVLNGHKLTRREYKLLIRVVGDIFRLIPFSVFIIVPFMELLLPVFIKLFPGMLPSTFQTAKDTEEKMKQSLKVKLKMAKFLQQTLDEMGVAGKGRSSESAKQFAEFFERIRSGGGIATKEEILRYSKLFQDEITLDSLPRPQLMALCRVLEIQPFGTTNFLRFQLQMKLRSLAADDKMIQKEGVDSLDVGELQQACKARGMRALGMSEQQMRAQLAQWLQLSLDEKVPPSLLLLTRAFMLPDTISTEQQLAATISALPDILATSTQEAIGELEGQLDNKTRLQVTKQEVQKIVEERKEDAEEERQKEILLDKAPELVDTAPILVAEPSPTQKEEASTHISGVEFGDGGDGLLKQTAKQLKQATESIDVGVIENALDSMGKTKKKLIVEKEELNELKEELAEYKEDVEDLKELPAEEIQVKETKAAKRLFKVVNKMINKLDAHVEKLEEKGETLKKDISQLDVEKEASDKQEEVLRIDEVLEAIRKLQEVGDESRLARIKEVLAKMDDDLDGAIRLDTVLKVIDEIGSDSLKLSRKQMDEIVELIKKEEELEEASKELAAAKEKEKVAKGGEQVKER
ncbi:mitochondrial proton/calcium exchanger protein isoform X2 [Nilaparvata lugens]|uniref:mitochondrial proton/calcium exchanger protein isoform X2 n=1 Tax=Nilaparvata lugens TaxID=108931 RepID=UPI00193E72AE|nr:mitochondrial proton/calcium exchanger protein isoform X2 [Nilaparvata lugens]